jgi:hypothetical protein
MVCRLRRFLYGLKQAPCACASVITVFGFSPSPHDTPCLFILHLVAALFLFFYVDDMIITGDDFEYTDFVKARLSDQFLMSNLGYLCFLGIGVSSTSDSIYLS